MAASNDRKKDEIDLIELFRRAGWTLTRWIKALGRGILISIVFLFRKWIPLTISLLIGAGACYIMKKSFTPYYSSELTIKSNTISNADMIPYLNRLHFFCRENNKQAIASDLSVPQNIAEKIKDIQAFWVIDLNNDSFPDYVDYNKRYNVYDTINKRMKDRLVIRVRISSSQDLAFVRDGIFRYVKSNPLFRERNSLRLANEKEMLARLNYDIIQLDSLQKVKYFEETRKITPNTSSQMVFLQEQNTQLLYDNIYKLFERKQKIVEELDLYPEIITLLADFTIPKKPYTGMTYYGIVVIPVFFGLTIILLIIMDNRKKLIKFLKKY